MSTFQAIPTIYRRRQYRSRLEARWAAFFDVLGWRYEYEPCDFKGWIPDFVLYGKGAMVFVEVKPVLVFPEDVASEIMRSECTDEVLIVGMTVPLPDSDEYYSYLGWLREDEDIWDRAVIGMWNDAELNPKGIIGFCHDSASWQDRMTGLYDQCCGGGGKFEPHQIVDLWAEAGNAVQWHSPVRKKEAAE